MLARIHSSAIYGVDAKPVVVEVDVSGGAQKEGPRMMIVGLPDAAVRESAERVAAAIRNSGFEFPRERITVNLAPADIRKEGPAFDLPIALGIVVATAQAALDDVLDTVAVTGELSLDGQVRPISGALPMAIGSRDAGRGAIIVPAGNANDTPPGASTTACVCSKATSGPSRRSCPSRTPTSRTRLTTPTWRTCAGSPRSSARWRSRPPADTTV
jgi:magnesium chelatase family protein